ncbi:magnesium/cobalt transporter CorA [Ulvibacterium marinum]|uniref:Magnesium transport protein CorA n=1 Tax=Ulvibacterium marinum TaxID=2419782 RepID=A0A3B0BP66_9FLAO|nr:magnesium/cobalt transporter CorA [Ulvibacterium marinum]RKN75145.1 magnesium and cobalt transport protein CorA [Ulvibacterium marinum]
MARFLVKRSQKLGTAPGSLIFVGKQKIDQVMLEFFSYDKSGILNKEIKHVGELKGLIDSKKVSWINHVGVHDEGAIESIGNFFHLHPLQLEDILNTTQRPKFEETDAYLFIQIRMLHLKEDGSLYTEQLSIVLMDGVLISFQEIPLDVFDPLRERLLRPTTKIRLRKNDYLAFAMLDAVVEQYIFIIEKFGERIEHLEDQLLERLEKSHLEQINLYKREINFLRKTIRPVRELVSQFKRSDSAIIHSTTQPYLRDLEEQIILATESIELYRDMLNDLLNLYNSGLNNRLNDILRVLTIFSVVFIPLTFLAGIYGTNFKYLPELDYRYAYPIFWLVLIAVAVGMILFFKKRKWL